MPEVISATKVRENFADILNRVNYAGEEFIVERQGKPTALITTLSPNKKKSRKKKFTTNDFLLKLTTYGLKDAPPDFAENHDKYAWE